MEVRLVVNLPADTEARLRLEQSDLSASIREVVLVHLFRHGKITHAELAQALGLDRVQTDLLLKRHQVSEQSLTHEEVDADVANLGHLLGRSR